MKRNDTPCIIAVTGGCTLTIVAHYAVDCNMKSLSKTNPAIMENTDCENEWI